MLKRDDLKALAAHEGKHPVVSVYLYLDPRLRDKQEAYVAQLKTLLKQLGDQAPEADLAAIEDFFHRTFDWTGRGVAVFSAQGDGFWRAWSFAVPVRSAAYVGPKPFILPLANLMDTYGSFAVALVDQQEIQMTHFHLGEVVARDEVTGDEVRRVKEGGGASVGGRGRGGFAGRERESVRSNLRDFAEALDAFCSRRKVERLLLAGSEPTVAQFKEMLGPGCEEHLEGTFKAAMRTSEQELLELSLQVLHANNLARETRLLETIQTQAARGANGVVDLEPTLKAVEEGRVQTLALVEGALEPEVAHRVIWQTIDNGGDIVFVEPDAPVVPVGGIGALLRY